MGRTGMGFDTSVFMSMPTAYELLLKSNMLSGDIEAIKDYASALMVKVAPGYEVKDVTNAIMQRFAIEYNLDFMTTKSMVSDLGEQLGSISMFIYILSAFLLVVAVVVLFVVFSSTINERKRELSLLRLLGASRKKLAKLIMREALYIGLLGAVSGVGIACALLFPFATLIFNKLGLPYLQPSFVSIGADILITFIVATLAGPLASLYSALALTRYDTYTTMREGE